MRIGIDARLYGIKNRGLGRYVKELVDGLLAMDNQNEYVIFCSQENVDEGRRKMKDKHYSTDKKGKLMEVRKNYRHKCIEQCDDIKRIRKIMHLCEDLCVELMNNMNLK